jgi:hypothetical protein
MYARLFIDIKSFKENKALKVLPRTSFKENKALKVLPRTS